MGDHGRGRGIPHGRSKGTKLPQRDMIGVGGPSSATPSLPIQSGVLTSATQLDDLIGDTYVGDHGRGKGRYKTVTTKYECYSEEEPNSQ